MKKQPIEALRADVVKKAMAWAHSARGRDHNGNYINHEHALRQAVAAYNSALVDVDLNEGVKG